MASPSNHSAVIVLDKKRISVRLPLAVHFRGTWYQLDQTKKHGGLILTRLFKPLKLVSR